MKRFCIILMSIIMVFSFSVCALAAETVYEWNKSVSWTFYEGENWGGSIYNSHSITLKPEYIGETNQNKPQIHLLEENGPTCTSAGKVKLHNPSTHSYVTVQGTTNKYCNSYGHDKTVTVAPLNHIGTEFTIISPATCFAPAIQEGFCKYCNTTVTIPIADSQLTHSFTSYNVSEQADCTNAAVMIAECDHQCKTTDTISSGNPDPDAHNWGDWQPGEDGMHFRICLINSNHREEDPCTNKPYCPICNPAPEAQMPATGDHSASLTLMFALFAVSCFGIRRMRKNCS